MSSPVAHAAGERRGRTTTVRHETRPRQTVRAGQSDRDIPYATDRGLAAPLASPQRPTSLRDLLSRERTRYNTLGLGAHPLAGFDPSTYGRI